MHTEFYSALAQIIPVIFLALLVEMRVLEQKGQSVRDQALEAAGLLALAVAELSALGALYKGHDTMAMRTTVRMGVAVGAVSLLDPLLVPLSFVMLWPIVRHMTEQQFEARRWYLIRIPTYTIITALIVWGYYVFD